MPSVGKQVFHYWGRRYELSIDLNDEAIMEDALSVALQASVFDPEDDEIPKETLPAEVSLDYGAQELVVKIGEGDHPPAFRVPLGAEEIADHEERDLSSPDEHDNYWNEILSAARLDGNPADEIGEAVAEALSTIPVVDPLLGCLLKAGLSTLIGQAVSCQSEFREKREQQIDLDGIEETERNERSARPRWSISFLAGCLRYHGFRILGRSALRFGRCALSMGFA